MQSPQLEKGYTRIANEILEAMARMKLSPTQYRIIFVVWRYTYGFQRKAHELSLTFISEATGCDFRQVQRELKKLIESEILIAEQKPGKSRYIGFNKRFIMSQTDNGEIDVGGVAIGEIDNGRTDKPTIGEIDKGTIGEIDNQERKKENIKEIYDYYLSLNLIKHRTYTEDMAKAIKKAMKNNKYDIEYCKTLLKRHRQVVEATKDTPYPVKARGLSEFFGQKAWGATHLICSEYDEGGKYFEQYIKESEEVKKPTEPFVPKFKYFDL